jgi:signal transduction histidine kinase/ActR/RegA family two-component response regulator
MVRGNIVGASKIARDITERKLVERKAKAQLERLDLLHQITRAIGGRHDLESIYQVVLRTLEDNLSLDFGCICDYDSVSQQLKIVHVGFRSQALALELALTEQAHIPIDANGLSRCVAGRLVYEPNTSEVLMPFPQRLAAAGLHSLVVAPLLVESTVFGVLVAARREDNSFSSGECEFLRQVSEHVALAAHQAQLNAALQQAYDDLRETRQAVMQQERLRALGQMASGIAHDINNAISPIALYTESLLENEPSLSPRARRYLETTQHAIVDVAQTVSRMREFYRQREPELTVLPVKLNLLVEQVVELTRARWHDMPQQRGVMIEMTTELAPDLPVVAGVESEIREALINLIFNAVDAMPEGGKLLVRSKAVKGSTPASDGEPSPVHVHVEIVDTGIGMDEETQRRCLDPFFTTKGERGTGLGLAMVYGVVQRHSAELAIESALNKGTTVRLTYPASTQVTAKHVESIAPANLARRLRILIADDDPVLLKSVCDILEGDGHQVTKANGGQAAIDAFRSAYSKNKDEAFDVVITDLGMPYVDGRKVSSAIKALSSSVPIILLTGWGQRLVTEGDVPPYVDRVLSKPPKLRELREALVHFCGTAHSNRAVRT